MWQGVGSNSWPLYLRSDALATALSRRACVMIMSDCKSCVLFLSKKKKKKKIRSGRGNCSFHRSLTGSDNLCPQLQRTWRGILCLHCSLFRSCFSQGIETFFFFFVPRKIFVCRVLIWCRQALHQTSAFGNLSWPWNEVKVVSASFSNQIFEIVTYNPFTRPGRSAWLRKIYDLLWPWKISRSPCPRNLVCAKVVFSIYSCGWTTHWFRYMYNVKINCYLAHVCQLWTCCDLENSVKSPKSHRFDKHLYCIILVFLLIWLQSSHWISRHRTYNQYFVCLEFAVSIILWPYEMRSRSHNKLFFLPKIH